jgi:calcineurin-like phosphoesterase
VDPVPDGVLRVLVLGDICGEPGRKAVEQELPNLMRRTGAGFVIANTENAAGGYGVTPTIADGLLKAGVDCLTTGDHVYDRKEVWEYLGSQARILRPLNFPPQARLPAAEQRRGTDSRGAASQGRGRQPGGTGVHEAA